MASSLLHPKWYYSCNASKFTLTKSRSRPYSKQTMVISGRDGYATREPGYEANPCSICRLPMKKKTSGRPLTDAELSSQLQRLGADVGPINDSTRALYERQLIRLSRPSGKTQPLVTPTRGNHTKVQPWDSRGNTDVVRSMLTLSPLPRLLDLISVFITLILWKSTEQWHSGLPRLKTCKQTLEIFRVV